VIYRLVVVRNQQDFIDKLTRESLISMYPWIEAILAKPDFYSLRLECDNEEIMVRRIQG
jgi:hypothetical protein